MRYASARIESYEAEETYRICVSKHLQIIAGANASYAEVVHGEPRREIDAERVADDIASKIAGDGGA